MKNEVYSSFPVSGYAKSKLGFEAPILDIPMMSDYEWQLSALRSRKEHPELYEEIEDVKAAITRIETWLIAHEGENTK